MENDGILSPKANWLLEGKSLLLVSGTKRIQVNAREISAANSGRIREIKGCQVIPPETEFGGNIKFSKFPYDISLEINEPGRNPLAKVKIRFIAERNGVKNVISYEDVIRGHMVLDSTWYALSEDTLIETIETEKKTPGFKEGIITVGDYLRLAYKPPKLRIVYINAADEHPEKNFEAPTECIGLNAKPYPYQSTGIEWLKGLVNQSIGGILADEMGLGKTLQVIAVLLEEVTCGRKNNLVICPSSLMENWRREIEKFAPTVAPQIHHGSKRTGWPAALIGNDVVITTYETVLQDEALFTMIDWGVIVLDEAQAIKNPEAKRTTVIKSLKRRNSFAVTGTPVENSLEDLWSLLDFSMPGFLGSLSEFQRRYTDDVNSAEALRRLTTPLILRRRVSEVAKDLPEKIFLETALRLNESEASDYEDVKARSAENNPASPQLATLGYLRMYCCHPNLPTIVDLRGGLRTEDFGKIERLDQIISEIELTKEKLLIFTTYKDMSDRLCAHISSKFRCPTWAINGTTEIAQRQIIIDTFSKTTGLAALVVNPRAGGSGLNITAANHVIMYNPEWNPALEMQAIARAHRRGQTKPVSIHYLYYSDTVEEAMMEVSRQKRNLADTAVVDNPGDSPNNQRIINALQRRPIS
jgi:SNF2 family DNA or RNA helicase